MLPPAQSFLRDESLMTLRMRCLGGLILGVDLKDSRASDGVLVIELGRRLGEDDVNLANGALGDGVDLVVLVAGCDADFDWELHQAGEEDGVDGCVGFDIEFLHRGSECASEGHR